MNNADTALVGNGFFFHYCHSIHGLMALRIHHKSCPICLQKNPDYTPNKMVHIVSNIQTGLVVMIFSDQDKAIKYIQDHCTDNLAIGDSGFVE